MKRGDKINFNGHSATVLFVFAGGLVKIAYSTGEAIHILHIRLGVS